MINIFNKIEWFFILSKKIFLLLHVKTEIVAQLVRASDCGSEGRGFKSHQSPLKRAVGFSCPFSFYSFPQ